MNTVRKRIFCITTALLLAAFPLLSSSVSVQAAALPAVDAEASAEVLMMLWNLLVNGMAAAGACDFAGSYESERDLFSAFMAFIEGSAGMESPREKWKDFTITLEGGQTVSLGEYMEIYTEGSGALQLPDEETWARYRLIDGGGGSPEPPEPEEPDPDPSGPFSKIKSLIISSGFLADMGGFLKSLWEDNVDGITAKQAFALPEAYYDPDNVGAAAYYLFGPVNYVYGTYYTHAWDLSVSDHQYCFIGKRFAPVSDRGHYYDYSIGFYTLRTGNLYSVAMPGTSGTFGVTLWCDLEKFPQKVFTSLPIFGDETAALRYLQTGDDSGVLNGLCYDFPGLINSVPQTLSPLAGVAISPNLLPGLSNAVLDAVSPFPLPDLEPAENTQQYRDTIGGILDDHVVPLPDPEPAPDPVPDPDPVPEPEPVPDGKEDLKKYRRDLRGIFPFCLPFDLIALLGALDAEPVAPCFNFPFVVEVLDIDMTVALDMSFLDEVAQVVRTCETVGFIITLILATHKLIKW